MSRAARGVWRVVARMSASVALATMAALASGCGYRIVKVTDVTARRFAQDSAAQANLERQIIALRTRCQQDSLRLMGEIAAIRAQPAAPASSVADSTVHARDTEIAALKDQLTRANAELDRIKKRLANPRP